MEIVEKNGGTCTDAIETVDGFPLLKFEKLYESIFYGKNWI